MRDIYEQFYNALNTVGKPATFAGYNINYYQATPISVECMANPYDTDWLHEVEDCNQAEIIVPQEFPIVDKLTQMRYILTLLPQVVQKGLFDE